MSSSTSAHFAASLAELPGAEAATMPQDPDPEAPPQIETLARDLGVLTTQNRQLIQSVSRLLDLYETEKAQRQALQGTLDRILEEITSEPSRVKAEAMATDIRQAVSDDLKPLLHAIIDLLEITMRRTPFDISTSSEPPQPASAPESEAGDPAPLEPPDDLPRDLPEILTKSVEELMGRARRDQSSDASRASRDQESSLGDASPKAATARRRRSVLNQEERGSTWIPVTSDTA